VLNWVWPPAMLALVVWMVVCVHRQLQRRGGRWLLYPVIAVLALASIGGGYQTLGAAADAKASPMPGRLIDVGGHRLHLSCTGAGSPTVVLEPGAGGMSSNLGWIAPAVARDTRVCVYDRAGRGWSEPADAACRRGPGTRSGPASRPHARFAARSTSTSRRRPRPSKLPPCVTSPTGP
jgi:hypothetical protein